MIVPFFPLQICRKKIRYTKTLSPPPLIYPPSVKVKADWNKYYLLVYFLSYFYNSIYKGIIVLEEWHKHGKALLENTLQILREWGNTSDVQRRSSSLKDFVDFFFFFSTLSLSTSISDLFWWFFGHWFEKCRWDLH